MSPSEINRWFLEKYPEVSIFVGVCLAGWFRYVDPYLRRRAIWTFKKMDLECFPAIIIDQVKGESTSLYQRPSTGYGAVVAVAQITNSLNASRHVLTKRSKKLLDKPIDLCFASDQIATHWLYERDVIVVGGPKNNRIADSVLSYWNGSETGAIPRGAVNEDDASSSLRVWTEGNTIHWFGEEFTGQVTNTENESGQLHGYSGIDYGVVLRLPNPSMTTDHRVVVLFGSQTFGIIAATNWLVKTSNSAIGSSRLNPLLAPFSARKRSNIAALLRLHVNNGVIDRSDLVDLRVLDQDLKPARWALRSAQ